MDAASLLSAVNAISPGPWAVGVSGGADSVALLSLLRACPTLSLRVVHLDHETRAGASADDARFVQELSSRWDLPCDLARRSEVETTLDDLPANRSARFRASRMAWFGQVVRQHDLHGVILAHHADDQAETILHRLLRGSGPAGLGGMAERSCVGGLTILRPLLSVHRQALREYLARQGLHWRQDASNESPDYLRNRLRRVLGDAGGEELTARLLELGSACRRMNQWVGEAAPKLEARFASKLLARLPSVLAEESARRWLRERGVKAGAIVPAHVQRLITMASDAASGAQQTFPGRLRVRRRRGEIFAETGGE